jgi:uncharacterized membrane protein
MVAGTAKAAPQPSPASRPAVGAGVAVAIGWLWSMGLLLQRVHVVYDYRVSSAIYDVKGWLLSLLIVVHPTLFWMTFLAVALGWMAARAFRPSWPRWARAVLVAGFWVVPALELARVLWPVVPPTFLEPIALAVLAGWVVRDFVRLRLSHPARPAARGIPPWAWFAAVVVLAAALGAWWFWLSHRAYDDYALGYFDFGHFARRVINTWRGVGFLQQTPGLPAFWDHFNPGLAALAPLWGLWPDAHLFFALQALCLAVPAVFVYGIARRLGAASVGAAAWATAYLMWPVVQQLNYNFSYGWHPVSTALPLLVAAVWCLVCGRKLAALVLAVAACSFKEDVLATTITLAGALALMGWLQSRRTQPPAGGEFPWLPPPRWSLLAGLLLAAAAVVIVSTTPFVRYQVTRAGPLGNSLGQSLLSPVRRPAVFWREVLCDRSLYFLLILFLPFGVANAARGWPILISVAVPLAALLAWRNANAKSIAFQYVTCPIAVITWAALVGARRSAARRLDPQRAMMLEGATALATALGMALAFGTLPSSARTTPFHHEGQARAAWAAHCRKLDAVVALVNRPDASVVATGRVAAHLLGVRRLEPLCDALDRCELLAREAGPGKTWMDVFEWVLLDRQDMLRLGRENIDAVAVMFVRAGYQIRYDEDDILLLQRPAR